MSAEHLAIIGLVSFVTTLFSSISGGGAGFINTPALIFLGLSPAQAVASGKFAGLTVAIGSLAGMRAALTRTLWHRALPIVGLACAVGITAPFVIVNLDSDVYRRVLGVLLLLMIPVLVVKKVGYKQQATNKNKRYAGTFLLVVALWLQGVFSGGLGTLVNVVLMSMFGMSALEANITKRYAALALNSTIVLSVMWSSLVVWPVVAVMTVTTLSGSYLGGRIAVKKGDKFVMDAFIVAMIISSVLLLVG